MPLELPVIDDRTYQQLLDEALARIPVHNPEWTNFNDSDPGITLIQLFAFMTESLLYRSNLIPERNRIKFLQLLGIPLQPAASAHGLVTFSNPRGPLQAETLSAGLEVFSGRVPFRTEDGLDVLPIEAKVYYKQTITDPTQRAEIEKLYRQLYASYAKPGVTLDFYEAKPLEAPASGASFPAIDLGTDTMDGALWIALMMRQGETSIENTVKRLKDKILTLGVLPALSDAERVLLPGGDRSAEGQPSLVFDLATLTTSAGEKVATYRPLDSRASGDLASEPGVVEITLPSLEGLQFWNDFDPLEQGVGDFPPSLEDTAIQNRVIAWIRIKAARPQGVSSHLSVRLSWIGINAARITQRAHVTAERLGIATGEPDQTMTLVNTPVIPGSVRLMVGDQLWQEIDDLHAAGPEVPVRDPRLTPGAVTTSGANPFVYTVDRESGEIRFGDGMRGARPAAGRTVQASYDYGGGRQGMVGIGAITKAPSLPAGLKVTNPIPTWGGDEAETVDEAERRIPKYLQHRDRLVTGEDYEEITWRTPGVDLGRVEVLPLFHPQLQDVPAAGVVTVMVIPRYDIANPETPEPDRLFLDTICDYLDPRRLITTELHVRGPEYKPIWLSVGINVLPGRDIAPVREAVKQAIRDFLSPLTGGFDGTGWPLQRSVDRLELWSIAARVDGIAKVNDLLLTDETGVSMERVPLSGLMLPRLAGLSVQSGEPLPLADLLGMTSGSGAGGGTGGGGTGETPTKVVPIPVIPSECC